MEWLKKASACPVLAGIEIDRLAEVLTQIQYQVKRFKKDEVIAVQGESVNGLIILLSGSIRGEMTDYSGKMLKIEDVEAPKPIAGAFLFGKFNQFPVDVIANENGLLLFIYKDQFLKLLTICPQAQVNYLNLVSSKAQFLSTKIKFLSFKTLKGKIAHYLLQLKAEEDGLIRIPVSQQSMAELFGVARPSVARVFSQLDEQGILSLKNRRVKIVDRAAILALLDE